MIMAVRLISAIHYSEGFYFGLAGLGAGNLVDWSFAETSIASCGTNGIRFAMQNVLMLS